MHPDYYRRPLFLLLAAFIIFILSSPRQIPPGDIYFDSNSQAAITGRIIQNPQIRAERVNVFLKVYSINGRKVKSLTYARLPAGAEVNFMDVVEARGYIGVPHSVDIPGNFNWAQYLANKKVYTQLTVQSFSVVSRAPWYMRALNYIRKDILQMFNDSFSTDGAAVMGGIVLGEKGDIPGELHKAFNDSGAMHLLVASGGNVGFVTLMAYWMCVLLGIRHKFRLPVALVLAGIYTLLAGADAPLLRAYIMTLCAAAGLQTGRNSGAFAGLTFAAALILIFNPGSVQEVGFQMSFLATLIILLSVSNFRAPQNWPWAARAAAETFLITTAVQLVLLPIYANVFHRFSITAIVSNVFLVPLSAVLMGFGFLLYAAKITGILFVFKGVLFLCKGVLWLFMFLVNFFSSLPFSAIDMPALSAPAVAIFFICLFFVYNSKIFKYKKTATSVLCALMLAVVLTNPFKPKNYIYVLDAFGKTAVVLNIDGKTFVTRKDFPDEILRQTIYALSRRKADIEFSSDTNYFANKQIVPFKDIWPGESLECKGAQIAALWGVSKGYKTYWKNVGYSGTKKDSMSFVFNASHKILTGGDSNFVEVDGIKTVAVKNGSVLLRY